MGKPVNITDESFKSEVEDSPIPVLVDFWAPWCGPCRAIGPVLDELAGELSEKLKICKINIDEEQASAAKFQVMSIPTMILFKGGQVALQIVGAQSKDRLLEQITPHL